MRIELSCRLCGENHFTLEAADTDSSIVACRECGHVMGTLGELKEEVARMVLTQSAQPVPDAPRPNQRTH